jgi:hypothetical protein
MNFDFYLLLKLTRSREPEPKLLYSGSGSLRLRLQNTDYLPTCHPTPSKQTLATIGRRTEAISVELLSVGERLVSTLVGTR